MKPNIIMLPALVLMVLMSPVRAATVNYVLDHSNVFADITDYLSVSISDNTPGQLDFQVKTLEVLENMAGNNYGIQSFAFNFIGEPADWSIDDFLLPEGWRVQENKGMSEAGRFDVRIKGTGHSRLDPLQFSVLGLTLESIEAGFAAHVAGFTGYEDGYPGEHEGHRGEHEGHRGEHEAHRGEHEGRYWEEIRREWEEHEGRHHAGSAFFYGDKLVTPPPEVPLPAAVWLFASGLLGLAGAARRRRC